MASVTISLEEYLHHVYDPDVEYLEGELKDKSLVQSSHGFLQALLVTWFNNHREPWGVKAGVEIRTQVAPNRVRLPDVVVLPVGKWPEVLVDPPLIVIEILSPSDPASEIHAKTREYLTMGIANVWVIDPQNQTAWAARPEADWMTERLEVKGSPIYVDVAQLFADLQRDDEPAKT